MKALCQHKEVGWGVGGSVSGFDLTPNCFSLEDDQGYLCKVGGGGRLPALTKLKARRVGPSFD